MSNNPVEPSASLRELASGLYQSFVALTNEGFNERQALTIIGHMLMASGGSDE